MSEENVIDVEATEKEAEKLLNQLKHNDMLSLCKESL